MKCMKRHLTLLACLLAAAGAHAETHKCLDSTGCKPPPCIVFRQVKMKVALQRLFADPKLRGRAAGGKPADGPAAFTRLTNLARDLMKQGKGKNALPACKDDSNPDPPEFHTTPECTRADQDGTIGENGAQQKYSTCSELIAAEFRHEDHHKKQCEHTNSTDRLNASLADSADEEVNGYENEIADLRLDLRNFWMACSPTIDAQTRAQIIDAGVDILDGAK